MSDDYHSNLTSAEAKLSENDSNSEMDTSTSTLYKPKRPKFIRIVPCQVCGDDANDHNHYGGKTLYKNRGLKLTFQVFCNTQIVLIKGITKPCTL